MYELAPNQIECFVRRVMLNDKEGSAYKGAATITSSDEVLYGASSRLLKLHILPPTALALLSPDLCEIMVFPDRAAISIPRYSSLQVMMQQLQLLTFC